MSQVSGRDLVQSLGRGLAVLDAFEDATSPLDAAEVARRTTLSRPAVRRLLLTLVHHGWVRAAGEGGFVLAPHVLRLGHAFRRQQPLVDVVRPHLRRLVDATGQSCSVAVLDGGEVVVVERALVRRLLRVSLEVGARLPAHATAMGQVLLAALPDDEREAWLHGAPFAALTPRTLTTPHALRGRLEAVRSEGHCLVDEELEVGIVSAAAPLRDETGEVVAAVASSRRADDAGSPEGLVGAVVAAATAMSADLGAPARDGR